MCWITKRNGTPPFDPTLLSPSSVTHFFADDSPKDIIVEIFALVDSHLRYNLCEFLLLFLVPGTGDTGFTICNMVAIAISTV